MWQVYSNLFFYSFCYYLAKGPLAEVGKDIAVPPVMEKFNSENNIFTTTVLGALLLGFFQDKVGSRFAINLSQLSSFLIYAIGLLKYDKEITAAAGPEATAALKFIPQSAFVLIKILPALQHTMFLGKSSLICLRPWDQPMVALRRMCYALVSYSAGLGASTLLIDAFGLKGANSLGLAAGFAFFAWFMNNFTFPERQRAPAATPGTRVEDAGSYLSIAVRNYHLFGMYLGLMIASKFFADFLGPQDANAPAALTAFATKMNVKAEYLVSPIVALVCIPAMSFCTKTPGGVIRFAFMVATIVVIVDSLVKAKYFAMDTTQMDWAVSVLVSRTMYLVPTALVLTSVMPGTQGQTAALLVVVHGISGKVTPIVAEYALKALSGLPFPAEAVLAVLALQFAMAPTVWNDGIVCRPAAAAAVPTPSKKNKKV